VASEGKVLSLFFSRRKRAPRSLAGKCRPADAVIGRAFALAAGAVVVATAGSICRFPFAPAGLFQLPLHAPAKFAVPIKPAELHPCRLGGEPGPQFVCRGGRPAERLRLSFPPACAGPCDIPDSSDHRYAPSPSSARANDRHMAAARARGRANAIARQASARVERR
jgi:hypothetical protein